MSRFATSAHLASWARICSGHPPKRRQTAKRGDWHGQQLVADHPAGIGMGRLALARQLLGAQYRRISKRRGPKRAAIAVAHSILVIAYYILRDDVAFADLGADYFDRMIRPRPGDTTCDGLEELGCDREQSHSRVA